MPYSFSQFINQIEDEKFKEDVISLKGRYVKSIQDDSILPDKFCLDDILFEDQEKRVVICVRGYDLTKGWFHSDYVQLVFFYPEGYTFPEIMSKTRLSHFNWNTHTNKDGVKTFELREKTAGEQYLIDL